MSPRPTCPNPLPAHLVAKAKDLAAAWLADPCCPNVTEAVMDHWHALVADWAADPNLPLLVRKDTRNRGSEVRHSSGRVLIPVDNSPAQWAYGLALDGACPSIQDIAERVAARNIPVALGFFKDEREKAVFRQPLGKSSVNKEKWKLGHVENVGLYSKQALESFPIEELRRHFLRFMSPANMFAVPLVWAGLAELPETREIVRQMRARWPLP